MAVTNTFSTKSYETAPVGNVGRLKIILLDDHKFIYEREGETMTLTMPKSPEPTAVGACRSAVAIHVAHRRWFSFFRST